MHSGFQYENGSKEFENRSQDFLFRSSFHKKVKNILEKNFKIISEKSFSKKIFFRLEKHSQVVSALKAKNVFLRLTDQPFFYDLLISTS